MPLGRISRIGFAALFRSNFRLASGISIIRERAFAIYKLATLEGKDIFFFLPRCTVARSWMENCGDSTWLGISVFPTRWISYSTGIIWTINANGKARCSGPALVLLATFSTEAFTILSLLPFGLSGLRWAATEPRFILIITIKLTNCNAAVWTPLDTGINVPLIRLSA